MAASPTEPQTSIDIISQPLKLHCGLELPNRLVKCPMQETLAKPPLFDPPLENFALLYKQWADAKYGLIITGQVQIDLRFLSIAGDVVSHKDSLTEPHISKWKQWAAIAKSSGTPCIVQLAHPGRMSPAGAGMRPSTMQTLCPSSVPVEFGDTWLDKMALKQALGTPKEMTMNDIDEVVEMWKHATNVAKVAGFDGVQLHGAHGFLLSEFLSPRTNKRTDEYGGTPEKRMKLLKRLVTEIREAHPSPFCLSVKLNSADYMGEGEGLQQEEGLEQVRWLVECGMVDFVEISGGNAEQKTSNLHNSFGGKTMEKGKARSQSTRIREAFFTEFAEKVQAINAPIPIQLSGGFRSRTGMADAIDSGVCQMIGLGRAAVLEPTLPIFTLLNPSIPDEDAVARSHQIQGQWISNWNPIKIVGSGWSINFFYHQMRRLGNGLNAKPEMTILGVLIADTVESLRAGWATAFQRIIQSLPSFHSRVKHE